MFKQVAHICIASVDLAACENFYCNVLGLKKQFLFEKEGRAFGFYIALGNNTFIEVFVQSEVPNRQNPPIKHICLEVEDIDQVITMVRSKGWAITDKKMGCDQSWQCWLKDADGVDIELHQYTPESSQFTGKTCQVDW